MTYDQFMSARFVRLRRIRELLSANLIDEMLRRKASSHIPMRTLRSRKQLADDRRPDQAEPSM